MGIFEYHLNRDCLQQSDTQWRNDERSQSMNNLSRIEQETVILFNEAETQRLLRRTTDG